MSSDLVQDKNNEYGKSKDGLANFFKVKNKVDEYKRNAYLKFSDEEQLEYLRLYKIFNENIIEEFKNERSERTGKIILKGDDEYNENKDYYMSLEKKSNEGNNEIKNFKKAREELEKQKKKRKKQE